MKRIVNTLLYDTDVSEEIYHDKKNNRRWYKTSNGNFFVLYGTGEIAPKTEKAVQECLGENDIEMYIKLFGEPQEA